MDQSVTAQILAGLNEEQHRAVTIDAPQLVIRAGAGSGKTRVLTRRIAYGAMTDRLDPRRVLALTFTRKAAGELNHRLRQLGLRESAAAGTFHAVALAQLRRHWENHNFTAPTLLDRKVGFVARLVPGIRERTIPLDLVSEIEWAKARRIKPETYVAAAADAARSMQLPAERVAEIYQAYEEAKTKRNLIDFDDILILCGRALQQDKNAAAAFRWSYRSVFVDEFQDVNTLQFALLKVFVGPTPDLCVVGDSRQAIYAWNGADSSYLDNFTSHFPEAVEVALSQNYRSTPEILRCASALLPTYGKLTATLSGGPKPTITNHANEKAEARSIARSLRNARSASTRWRDMAVLVRTNAQVTLLADALDSAEVPVRARHDSALVDRPEIKDTIDSLRQAAPSGTLADALDELGERLALSRTDDDDEGDAADDEPNATDERQLLLSAFLRLGRDHLALDPAASLQTFIDALKAGNREIASVGDDRVEVTTFHQAKGLEWEVVHLAGMEQGLAPIGHAKTPEAKDEEDRLIYVAVTRAKRHLHLHWADERTFGDRVSNRSESPMIEPIRLANQGIDPRANRNRNAKSAGDLRRNLAGRNGGPRLKKDESDPVFKALKKWRLSKSKANDVPAFVIFSDKTLHAIVKAQPTSKSDLLDISGIGPSKAESFGDEVLELISESLTKEGGE